MIRQKKLHRQIKALKTSKAKAENELAKMLASATPNDMKKHRIQTDIRQLDEKIKSLESTLIPDIIA